MTKNTSMSLGDHFEGSADQQIESDSCGSASEVVRLEDQRQVAALRQTLIDGENSGDPDELDMKEIKEGLGSGRAVDGKTPPKPTRRAVDSKKNLERGDKKATNFFRSL